MDRYAFSRQKTRADPAMRVPLFRLDEIADRLGIEPPKLHSRLASHRAGAPKPVMKTSISRSGDGYANLYRMRDFLTWIARNQLDRGTTA